MPDLGPNVNDGADLTTREMGCLRDQPNTTREALIPGIRSKIKIGIGKEF
jgi:hypothetical protein